MADEIRTNEPDDVPEEEGAEPNDAPLVREVPSGDPSDEAVVETEEASCDTSGEVTVVETEGATYEITGSAPAPASAPEPEAAKPRYHPSYVFLVVVTLLNLGADLWSKHWAKTTFESIRPGGERRIVVIEDVMNFIFAKNRGGAWGLLQNETEAIRRPFFLIVSVAAIVFIVSLYRKLQPGQTALKWGLPLVLGGALGNLIDRIRYGYVVDFIDVYVPWGGSVEHWPTFNVADISICVGVGLMAIDMFTARDKKKAASSRVPTKVDEKKAPAEGTS